MGSVEIGRITTTTAGAKLHLAVDGKTYCGARSHATIAYPGRVADVSTEVLCKRCFTAAHLDRAALRNSGSRFSTRIDSMLCTITETLRSPAERARVAAIAARVAPVRVLSGFAGIVAGFGTTPNFVHRDRAARRARRLTTAA